MDEHYEIKVWYSEAPGDECFVAQVAEMPGVMAHGNSREEAVREVESAIKLALEVYAENGEQPPAPKNHAAAELGRRGGLARSVKKSRAARRNGSKGGRPRIKSGSPIAAA